jgi:hypothetical protein
MKAASFDARFVPKPRGFSFSAPRHWVFSLPFVKRASTILVSPLL